VALPPPSSSSTCLVTGASSGIGAEIARELARRGHGVTLVARREDRLRVLGDELAGEHGIRAEVVDCDLADAAARERLVAAVASRGLEVEVLVNNAGFGSGGVFKELDLAREIEMVRTNVEAVVALCGAYVPSMAERRRGAILNLASIAGFQPIPRQATYAATKAAVLSFSDSLHVELRPCGVTVTSLCPGPVPTEFSDVAGLDEEVMERLPSFLTMSAEEIAAAGVRGLERGRRTVTPGPVNTVSAMAGQFSPRALQLAVMDRFYPVRD
jgi:short-subunit dehydrogenase